MKTEWISVDKKPDMIQSIGTWKESKTILVWIKDANCHAFGRCIKYGKGDYAFSANGYNGNWEITHWMPLPDAPK